MPEVTEAVPPKSLREIMRSLHTLPRENWLFISRITRQITLDVVCHQVAVDDYSDDELELYCNRLQLRDFFFKDQLEDIRRNLQQQRPDFGEPDLEAAINYYWRHDAFIRLT